MIGSTYDYEIDILIVYQFTAEIITIKKQKSKFRKVILYTLYYIQHIALLG